MSVRKQEADRVRMQALEDRVIALERTLEELRRIVTRAAERRPDVIRRPRVDTA